MNKSLESVISSMVCTYDDHISLSKEHIDKFAHIDGEKLILKASYEDFEDELETQKIKYKLSQSLSLIVCYEDDGKSFQKIERFVQYIHSISDDKQNSTFGIKKVDRLSDLPITMLFSGILPINQLKMSIGKEIGKLIKSDEAYFKKRFKKLRDDISKEIGIPILPVLPKVDEDLESLEVKLVGIHDGKIIANFWINEYPNKDTLEVYLLKLFYIYKVLAS